MTQIVKYVIILVVIVREKPSQIAKDICTNVTKNGNVPGKEIDLNDQLYKRINYGTLLTNNYMLTFPYSGTSLFYKWVEDNNKYGAGMLIHEYNGINKPSRRTLSEDGLRMLDLPNAGGNSVISEVMSLEVLKSLFNCTLAFTEMELTYFPYGSSITDYSVNIQRFPLTIGISVTRAMSYGIPGTPKYKEFNLEQAIRLLNKKLYGVINATRCVMKEKRWRKQVLHVWVQESYMIDYLIEAYKGIKKELRADTLVIFTISSNAHYIYTAEPVEIEE